MIQSVKDHCYEAAGEADWRFELFKIRMELALVRRDMILAGIPVTARHARTAPPRAGSIGAHSPARARGAWTGRTRRVG